MPVIPTYEEQAQLDSDARGQPRVNLSDAPMQAQIAGGRALQNLGSQVEAAGATLGRQQQKQQAEDAANAAHAARIAQQQTNFSAGLQDDMRRQATQNAFDTGAANIQPDGSGFHEDFTKTAQQIAADAFKTMPPSATRDQAMQSWHVEQQGWSDKAAAVQVQQQKSYSQAQIGNFSNNALAEVQQNPDAMDSLLELGRQRITSAPGLSPDERAQQIQQFDRNVIMTGLSTKYATDPDGLKKALGLLDKQGLPAAPAGQGGIGSDAAANRLGVAQPGATTTLAANAPQPAAGIGSDITTQARNPAFSNAVASGRAGQAMAFFQGQGWSQAQAAGIVGNLMHESGGLNTAARNAGDGSDGSDSVGIAQWNGQRARNLAAFAAQRGTSPTDFGTQLLFVQKELTGDHSAAGDALRKAADVQGATAAVTLKYEMPAGSNTGVAENTSGWQSRLRNASALAGGRFPAAGPAAHANPTYAALSVQDTQQLIASAEAGRSKAQAAHQQQLDTDIYAMGQTVDKDTSSVQETGQGVPDLEMGHVSQVLGPEKAQDWADRRAAALDTYKVTAALPQMTNDDLHAAADQFYPGQEDKTDPTYARRAATYQAVQAKARKILDDRTADPAGVVVKDPAVVAAFHRFSSELSSPSPAAIQGIVEARLAAQHVLGIPDEAQSPITLAEANAYVGHMRPQGQQTATDALNTVVDDINTRFGNYAPSVLSAVLRREALSKSTADVMSAGLLRAQNTTTGPIVTTDEGHRLVGEQQANALAQQSGAVPSSTATPSQQAAVPSTAPAPSSTRKGSYLEAVDRLQKDPGLMPFFIQRYGASRLPNNLRNQRR